MVCSKNILMRLIEVLSFSKTYNGRGKYLIRLFSFTESFFKLTKKLLIKKAYFIRKQAILIPINLYRN